AGGGTALVLADFTYQSIDRLAVRLEMAKPVRRVRSVEHGPLKFTVEPPGPGETKSRVRFELPLRLTDVVLIE
ncbi:MAG: hypothetical protein N2C14_04185, partial [Planctomycetales bacterium]